MIDDWLWMTDGGRWLMDDGLWMRYAEVGMTGDGRQMVATALMAMFEELHQMALIFTTDLLLILVISAK